jgi:hypothetical protein
VERWTQKYATSIGLGGSYGHSFKKVMLGELFRFDSVVICDGVHDGTDGAIYRHWREGETAFDKEVAKSISHTRWLHLHPNTTSSSSPKIFVCQPTYREVQKVKSDCDVSIFVYQLSEK